MQLKYADVLLKGVKDFGRQERAFQIYDQLWAQFPGRSDIRRRLAELSVEMERYPEARQHLEILLKDENEKKDGKLHFLLGRCLEVAEDAAGAEASYKAAIEHGAPQRLEASGGEPAS